MRNASTSEKWVVGAVLVILLSSFGLLLISALGFGIGVATCVNAIAPFQKGELIQHDPTHYEVHFVARMWSYDPPEITIPPDAELDIYLTSADVTHGFIIPGTNVNMMAVPGAVNYTHVKIAREGRYPAVCHEYCGAGHQAMSAMINVANIGIVQPEGGVAANIPQGLRIMRAKGCVACHTTDGTPGTGPTLKGLFGRTETLSDGSSIRVDEAYVRESILLPQARIVKGFAPIMPAFRLTDDELHELVEYLKTLRK